MFEVGEATGSAFAVAMAALSDQRSTVAVRARDHFPVLVHSAGIVCRCHTVFRSEQGWADHLGEVMIP